MKRYALAGTFATIGGLATLILVASILYSCRQGGTPHKTPYNSSTEVESGSSGDSDSSVAALHRTGMETSFSSGTRLTFEQG